MRAPIERRSTPWHLWVIGVITLVWNAIGAFDYTMTQTVNIAYLEQVGMGAQELAWLAAIPWWADACWALGVWGALLGSILLLARSKWAATAYVVSLIGIVPTTFYQFASDRPPSFGGSGALALSIVLIVLAVVQLWYALNMRAAGVLR